ncbi:MAG: undecaprenyl-diphosphate phosphatase [Alphaproteobacteria bacterium]|nr:undecaprenyl-diphosphate phosphatase [Alphaproteobacteria bacterium]
MTFTLLLLCFVQGVTEFLPVSSSAHMIMLQQWIGDIPNHPDLYVGLHLGTLCAVVTFYIKDIFRLSTRFIVGTLDPKQRKNDDFNLSLCVLIATLPALALGFFLKPYLAFIQENFLMIALSSITFGGILAFVDHYANLDIEDISKRNALFIGLGQLFAFLPGGSRLGTTITVARMLGMSRSRAFYFSMLLSVPVVLGACVLMAIDGYKDNITFITEQSITAMLITFLIGLMSLSIMHYCVDRVGYAIFGIYRIFFGFLILLWMWAVN